MHRGVATVRCCPKWTRRRAVRLPFAKADGTEAEDLATKLDIKGYPTLVFIRRGGGPPIEYDGQRSAQPISKWAQTKMAPPVSKLATDADVAGWIKGKPVALVLFVGQDNAPEVEALTSVAASADGSIPCGVSTADPTSSALGLSALGALEPPVLVAFTTHDEGPSALRGTEDAPLTHRSMLRFGRAAAVPAVVAYEPGRVEETLFAAEVPLHLLYFHTSAVDASAREALAGAGKQLKGTAVVATVDATAHKEIADFFNVRGGAGKGAGGAGNALEAPALVAFSLANGTKFALPPAALPLDGADSLVRFASDVLAGGVPVFLRSQPVQERKGALVELVGSDFASVAHDPASDVLVQFYAPDCGHCVKLRPVYEQVASKFADVDDLVVAQMDAAANDVLGLEPEGYPTIVLYTKANKRGLVYDGSRDAHDLAQFVLDARAGKNHIGGLPGGEDGRPDEDDGYRVEL